jgi:hypothetical protein
MISPSSPQEEKGQLRRGHSFNARKSNSRLGMKNPARLPIVFRPNKNKEQPLNQEARSN